jgi:antitoxin component YwqK of YwqJK toxin-antitoxin module
MTEKIRNGLHTEYYENGKKKVETNYKDGKEDGLWTEWYENGQKRFEGTYKDGKMISQKEWNEDGSVKE